MAPLWAQEGPFWFWSRAIFGQHPWHSSRASRSVRGDFSQQTRAPSAAETLRSQVEPSCCTPECHICPHRLRVQGLASDESAMTLSFPRRNGPRGRSPDPSSRENWLCELPDWWMRHRSFWPNTWTGRTWPASLAIYGCHRISDGDCCPCRIRPRRIWPKDRVLDAI